MRVRAPGKFIGDVPWHRENLPTLLQRATRSHASSTELPGLKHQNSDRDAADQPITNGEILWRRESPQGKFAQNGSARGEYLIDRKSTRLNSSHLGISYAV